MKLKKPMPNLMSNLTTITQQASAAIEGSADSAALDLVRVKYLGKKGELTDLLKALGKLPADERPAAGAEINVATPAVPGPINARKSLPDDSALACRPASAS